MFNVKHGKKNENNLTFGAFSEETEVNGGGFCLCLKRENGPSKVDRTESFLISMEVEWECIAKQTQNTPCTFMNMILYYDLYHTCNAHFGTFSNRIPSYGCAFTHTFQSNLNIIEIYSYRDLFLKGGTQISCLHTKEQTKIYANVTARMNTNQISWRIVHVTSALHRRPTSHEFE